MALHATYYGANGWLLEFGSLRVLLDPWLTGSLEFPPGPWFFQATLADPWPAPERLDLLLLSQGLPDHCHPASLALLDKQLPVVGSTTAAVRARQLGFTAVTALAPGDCLDWRELRITATAGAPVPQLENGYLLEHAEGRLYLEPHGFLAAELPAQPLDAVITPVVDLGLPVAGAFVKGRQVLPALLERFQPRTVLASTAGGTAEFSGLLTRLLWQKGSVQAAEAVVNAHQPAGSLRPAESGHGCLLIDPVPGRRYALATTALEAARRP
ncbi:MBL fold metallo-hydrolase [Synechococcus sp. CS-1325]|uniref:MBL fold metallo-hydrolase n=1 Tax=unclassified Synechococcus TaxID=2626047 RepID=UPI000DAFFD40|nr:MULTISPECIES: MBL fold metallo-hydrolase [unclassified Synechococcus]PZV02518.1 MAG: MBL fold metallo-hydrolase [Cyanobium sp.]MCT0200464.1 MBL fold metallo-hydrolase [Synechococcus sp. CS-1325]MCT0213033.1 MBL fold metallo-hydrolase [Synechococcus sp. CS-1326]MCT0229809.1 MBL fold metallo-hydrolase [Synechococcus sp. CS-1324]MCT0232278.1 MBL fold metallo-hydrolase [Synechococcus sp. CS-1327]